MAAVAYVNGYQPFDFKDFSGGLNLRDKADTIGDSEAIDLLNVTFNERGAIDQRDGYADLTPAELTNRVDSLAAYYSAGGARHLIAGCGTRLEALNAAGAVLGSAVGLGGGPWLFARFGDPTHEWLFAANEIDPLQRWDGAGWTSGAALALVDGVAGAAMPRAGAIAVTAAVAGTASATNASNRLIATAFGALPAAGPGGTLSTPSRVYFSNPGQPQVWETSGLAKSPPPTDPNAPAIYGRNYVDLTPGDGERIMAAVTWRELVFIFKETKFFVLWGEDVAADGTPTFQIREVVNSIGLASKLAVAVGRDGVYFFNRRGVYRTSGGDPVLLSDKLTPLWVGAPEVYYQGKPINLAQLPLVRMTWHMEQLFVAVPTGASLFNDRLLVYDTQHGWWTVYDIAASALAGFRRADQVELHHGYATGPKKVGHRSAGADVDAGGATIVSRWRSGWGDYASSVVKAIRETKLWGSGAVTVSFSVDFNQTALTALLAPFSSSAKWPAAGTWGAWISDGGGVWPGGGQVSPRLVRYAVRGTTFSTQFSNAPPARSWSVHRVARHLRETREASIT